MAQLPNHLIMDIIKLVDGGLNTHKQKFKGVMNQLIKHDSCGKWCDNPMFDKCWNCGRTCEVSNPHAWNPDESCCMECSDYIDWTVD